MTRIELRNAIAKRIEREFAPGKLNPDSSHRVVLDRGDCDLISNLVFSEIGQSGLGIFDKAADLAVGEV